MSKMFVLPLLVIVLSLLTAGCSEKTNYATEEPFIIVTYKPADTVEYSESFSSNVALYHNGRLVVYTTEGKSEDVDADAPIFESQLKQADVKEVKDAIKKSKFWGMGEDISIPSDDGSFYYTTVNLTDESKTVGGLNPNDARFFVLQDTVIHKIAGGEYAKWQEKTSDYTLETNP